MGPVVVNCKSLLVIGNSTTTTTLKVSEHEPVDGLIDCLDIAAQIETVRPIISLYNSLRFESEKLLKSSAKMAKFVGFIARKDRENICYIREYIL